MRKFLMIFGAILCGCSSNPETEPQANLEPKAVPVHIEEARTQDVTTYIESIGHLKPTITVAIRPQVTGILEKVYFSEGEIVKKGQPLFSIDCRTYQIKLKEAEADLAQRVATQDSVRKKLERYKMLTNKEIVSQQEWEDLNSQATLYEAQVAAQKARVEATKLDVENCEILSPITGRTGRLTFHAGNLISAGQQEPLVILSNLDNLVVEFTLTEKEFQQLTAEHKQGDYSFELCSFYNSETLCKSVLTYLDHHFNRETGLIILQGNLKNEKQIYLPGQNVHVRLPVNVLANAVVIPQKAVKINQMGSYVFVVKDDDTVDIRQLRLGNEIGKDVVVLEGLLPGEKMVTTGHLRLSPGMRVDIKPENEDL